MAPVIRVSDELYGKLANLAVGFDTPSNVIERLLDENKSAKPAQPAIQPATIRTRPSQRGSITKEMAMLTCKLGDKIFLGEMRIPDAKKMLMEIGMNEASAAMYLSAYRGMLVGEVFRRGVSMVNSRRMFEHIKKTYGKNGIGKAVKSYDLHLKEFEAAGYGERTRSKRAFLSQMRGWL